MVQDGIPESIGSLEDIQKCFQNQDIHIKVLEQMLEEKTTHMVQKIDEKIEASEKKEEIIFQDHLDNQTQELMRKLALLLQDSQVPMSLNPRKRISKQQKHKDPYQSDGTEGIEF